MRGANRESVDRTLAALADPVRRGVIDLLRKKPRNASALADALGLSRPAMSRHLRVLRKNGLVREEAHEADARLRMYQLEEPHFRELASWILEVQSFWQDQLESFRIYAETRSNADRTTTAERSARRAPR